MEWQIPFNVQEKMHSQTRHIILAFLSPVFLPEGDAGAFCQLCAA